MDVNMYQTTTQHYPRQVLRVWMNRKGEVVNPTPTEKDPQSNIKLTEMTWQAKVVNNEDGSVVNEYPEMGGVMTVALDMDYRREASLAYIDRLRFADNPKPDIEKLMKQVNTGDWEIELTLDDEEKTAKETGTVTHH